MTDLFKEIIPSIMVTKKRSITQNNKKDYVPIVVNKALSFHQDCVFHANQMNMFPGLDNKMQYDYLFGTIRGYRRGYKPWMKATTSDDIDVIKEFYKYSNEKAKEALSILSDEQVSIIKKKLDKGGLK